jgi:cytochrome c553
MRTLIGVLLLVSAPVAATAAEFPDWAYPVMPPGLQRPDPNAVITVPGSDKKYTNQQINDPFNPPDWFPQDHPPMPKVVANGHRETKVRACAQCHLTSGDGHPESSGVSGLPAAYIVRQLTEFKNGGRKGIRTEAMHEIATGISPEEAQEAAAYFSQLKPRSGYTKVVESEMVPVSWVGAGAMRFEKKGGGTEPLGKRIIELPQDEAAAEARNPRVGFIAHVPRGSIEKGKALVTTGGNGKTIQCGICHGPTLHGLGEVPPITNRSPMYIYRQLNDMQAGMRKNTSMALMQAVVAKLDSDDMIALAAYLGSLEP